MATTHQEVPTFPDRSARYQFHEGNGVKFYMQSKVEKIIPSDSDSSLAGSVVVTSSSGESTTLQADVVVMGVGVGPATEFLRNSKGFEQAVDRTGAVQVDEFIKVKGLVNVYAIGVFYDQHSSYRSNNVLAVR